MKQYITTQLVNVDDWVGSVDIVFPSLGYRALAGIGKEDFVREFHPIDRLEVGFGLAMEGMKHGLWFKRKAWPERADSVGMIDGELVYKYADGSGKSADVVSFQAADLVAEDWVVAP